MPFQKVYIRIYIYVVHVTPFQVVRMNTLYILQQAMLILETMYAESLRSSSHLSGFVTEARDKALMVHSKETCAIIILHNIYGCLVRDFSAANMCRDSIVLLNSKSEGYHLVLK